MRKKVLSWVIFGLGVVIAVRLGTNVLRLSRAGERLQAAKKELALAHAEQERLAKQLEEVNKPEFVQHEAREKLGLGKPGETVVILPNDNANPKSQIPNPNNEVEPNWRKWWGKWVGI